MDRLGLTRLSVLERQPRLPALTPPATWPAVVAVIPARNEEDTIGAVVGAHFASAYPGPFSVIVVNDHSGDETAERAFKAAAYANAPESQAACLERRSFLTRFANGRSFALIEAPPLAEGWTGKLAAVNAGLIHAAEVAPEARYVLLVDADIILAPQTLTKLVSFAEANGTALTSLMARLDARGFWGGLLIPAFVFFFQKLYPFHRANRQGDRIAAAAGGCILARRDALEDIGGVASIRGRLIDDCALADAIKKSGRRIWLGLAREEAVSLRDNRSLASIWSMVARSAFAQLRHSWINLAGVLIGMTLLYLAAPAIALTYPWHHDGLAAAAAIGAWALMALLYLPTALIYGQAPWKTFALPLAAFIYTLMTASSALDHARGRGGFWKGRTSPA